MARLLCRAFVNLVAVLLAESKDLLLCLSARYYVNSKSRVGILLQTILSFLIRVKVQNKSLEETLRFCQFPQLDIQGLRL